MMRKNAEFHRTKNNESGFTLIELLVVISIIALLVGILLPALGAARRAAIQSKCLQQMRQIAIGAQFYAHNSKDFLPYIKSPLLQGDQIYMLDPYISTKDVFLCPNAESTSSGGEVWQEPFYGTGFFGNHPYESYKGTDTDNYNQELWGPGVRYFTDYKLNDWKGPETNKGDGIIDRNIGELPYTTWTVIAIDIDWGLANPDTGFKDPTVTRHAKGENLSFLDGHSAAYTREEYWDPTTALEDPVGNHVWFRWGDPDPDN